MYTADTAFYDLLLKRLMETKVACSFLIVAEPLSKKYSIIFHYDTIFAYIKKNIRWPTKIAVTHIEANPQ